MSFGQNILRGSYYIMKDLRHQCHLSLGFYIAVAAMGVYTPGQTYIKRRERKNKSPNLKLG